MTFHYGASIDLWGLDLTASDLIQGNLFILLWDKIDNRITSYNLYYTKLLRTFRRSSVANTLSSNMVSSFAQTTNGDIYVGTELNGLNQFDKETNRFTKIPVLDDGGILNIIV